MSDTVTTPRAAIPSVDRILRLEAMDVLIETHGRPATLDAVRATLEVLRAALQAGAEAPGEAALAGREEGRRGKDGAGELGGHFPPGDAQWRGAPSSRFLEHARDLVLAACGRIDFIDLTIICEAPKVGPYRDAMRARIAGLLRLPESRISIKATTTEGLGFTGRAEGIAAPPVAGSKSSKSLEASVHRVISWVV